MSDSRGDLNLAIPYTDSKDCLVKCALLQAYMSG